MCDKKDSLRKCGMEEKRKNVIAAGGESNREEKCRNGQEMEDREKRRRERGRRVVDAILIVIILILLCLHSCRARDEPAPEIVERVYEEDHGREGDSFIPAAESGRLNLAVSECYRITDERPFFYIGFPEENVYDVVFTFKDASGEELYRTDYVSAGTNVAIDGTAFLEKGEQAVDCLVSIYDRDSGALVSDCTTIVLNVSYQ